MDDRTLSRAEQETIYRWDAEQRVWQGWTAYAPHARGWTKLGYEVEARPGGWSMVAPDNAIRMKRNAPKRAPRPGQFQKGGSKGGTDTPQDVPGTSESDVPASNPSIESEGDHSPVPPKEN